MSEQAISISYAPAPAEPVKGAQPKSFIAHAKLIGFLTLISRILGMARESVSANYFGAGIVASAFTVAFSIPNLFRKLFGEGALSAAFIPLYAQAVEREANRPDPLSPVVRGEGRGEGPADEMLEVRDPTFELARVEPSPQPSPLSAGKKAQEAATVPHSSSDFAAASVNLLCVLLFIITVLGELAIWATILLFPHMREDKLLTLKFTAVMLPYVLLICGTAFLSSILQVHKRFGAPAAAPILLNVVHIGVMVLGARLLHLHAKAALSPHEVSLQTSLAYWLCFFVLVAGVMQVMVLMPSLRAVGFRFRWVSDFWTPPVKRMLKMSVPVALGAGVLQLSVIMDKGISLLLARGVDQAGNEVTHFTLLGHSIRYPMAVGATARLNWAQFLYQFPLGVFAIALATAIFPRLSAYAMDKDRDRFRAVLRTGIEATLFEGLAASIGLIVVRYPAIRLLFQHGHVTSADVDLIARSVVFYSSAIWAFSLMQIINRAYYALHDTRTPLVMSVVNIVINLVVELPLVWVDGIGEAGMAVGTCVSFAVQALIMLWMLDRRIGGLGLSRSRPAILKMIVAAVVMGGVCALLPHLPGYPHGAGKPAALMQLAILMIAGGSVYVGVCAALGFSVLEHVLPRRKPHAS